MTQGRTEEGVTVTNMLETPSALAAWSFNFLTSASRFSFYARRSRAKDLSRCSI